MSDRLEGQDAAIGAVNEEAGEIVQVVGKMLRHGLRPVDTTVLCDGQQYDNVADLERECGDMLGAIKYACATGLLSEARVSELSREKLEKLTRIHG